MKIIAFVSRDSAVDYHRIITPLLLMSGVDIYITNDLQEKDFESRQPDILLYNRVLPDHAMEKIRILKAKYGFKICVDIDDYWHLDPHHVLHKEYQDIDFASMQVQHIQEADFVITTHERLYHEIRGFNTSTYIIPNAIPKRGQFDIVREPYWLTRLFWQGSVTHREDIELLRTPIEGIAPLAGKIKMVMGGYTPDEPEWHTMALTFTAQQKHQYKLIPGKPVTSYYENYKEADICLIPLVNTPFNRMKSNLKVLEAANLGLPVIASAVNPYLDMPLLYCKHSGDWIKHIRRLVESRKRQKEAGAELKEFCDEHYNFDKINRERKQVFEIEMTKAYL